MPVLRFLVPYLGYLFSTFIKLTTTLTVVRGEIRARLRSKNQRFIYAFWHQRQVFFTVSHRGDHMSMLISKSVDGEMIAETIRRCGVASIRGSSTRGASDAVRGLITALRSGLDIGITPDGPKGPKEEIKEGVMYLAQKLKVPILPITNAQSNRVILRKTWDQFQIPMPFGRSVVVYGEPIYVGADDDLKLKAADLKISLDAITAEAELLVA